jgi:hypothetical protein
MMRQFTMVCLSEAIRLSGCEAVHDKEFEKRVKHYYEDEIPISWYPMFRNGTTYYEKEWIVQTLKNYF